MDPGGMHCDPQSMHRANKNTKCQMLMKPVLLLETWLVKSEADKF